MAFSDDLEEAGYNGTDGVTVVIPVRNGADYVDTALQSALAQTAKNLRVVVSDNQSSDATPQILERYGSNSRVSVVRQTESLSMLAHFNKCLDLVDSKYYMLLCHDDVLVSPDALERAIQVAESKPEVSAVYCDLEYIDQAGRCLTYRRFRRSGEVDGNAIGRKSVISMRNHFGIPLLVRTAARSTHRYATDLPYVADVEMSWFLASVGKTYHLSSPHIANRYHATNSTLGLMKNTLREMEVVALKHAMPLTAVARLKMSFNSASVSMAKAGFFNSIRLRDAMTRG